MRRSICIFTLSFIVSSVFLMGSRCNGNPYYPPYTGPYYRVDYPGNFADLTESTVGNITVDESQMLVSSGRGVVSVGIPVTNETFTVIYATVHIELRDSRTKLVKSAADSLVSLSPGETYAVVAMSSDVADAPTSIKAGHIIYWRVLSGVEIVEGQKALLTGAALEYIKVIGPRTVFEGFPSSYRLMAVHPETGEPLAAAAVEIQFAKGGTRISTLIGTTDGYGHFTGSLTLPAGIQGPITLRCAIRKDDVNELFEQELQVGGGYKILLTTDKPQYQPGQTIHMRALALTQPARSPLSYTEATFEVFDGKKNKVFKSVTTTNEYGIANSSFILASELCSGDFVAKVIVGSNSADKTVPVFYYVLPKFNVTVTTDRSYYLPGDTVDVGVYCQYFFGKDVGDADVDISAFIGTDTNATAFTTIQGVTNSGGAFDFSFQLPLIYDPGDFQDGEVLITLKVTVTDPGDQVIEKKIVLPVSEGPAVIMMAPEGGRARIGADNYLYIAVADPVGRPIEDADLQVYAGTRLLGAAATDSSGFAQVTIHPEGNDCITVGREHILRLTAVATLPGGSTVEHSSNITVYATGALFARPDKVLYRVGETMTLSILAPGGVDLVFLEIISQSQLLVAQIVDLTIGSTVQTYLDTNYFGDCYISVSYINTWGELVTDTRQIHVMRTDALKITVTPDKSEYLPGESATIGLNVADYLGTPVQSAIGVTIVDEAVYHVSDMREGLAEMYFDPNYADGYMLPAAGYSYGDFTGSEVSDATQNAARLYFSLFSEPLATANLSPGGDVADEISAAAISEAESLILQLKRNGVYRSDQLSPYFGWNPALAIDPWGQQYIMTINDTTGLFTCKSRGPDEILDTGDDIIVTQ